MPLKAESGSGGGVYLIHRPDMLAKSHRKIFEGIARLARFIRVVGIARPSSLAGPINVGCRVLQGSGVASLLRCFESSYVLKPTISFVIALIGVLVFNHLNDCKIQILGSSTVLSHSTP